ncbi:MAG: cell envelope integrity protein TolA [Rhodomicrobium sp.]
MAVLLTWAGVCTGRIKLRKRGISGEAIFGAALAVSFLSHVWAISSAFQPRSRELGSVETATTAISVNLETTDIIDATESAATKEAASSPAGAPVEAVKETKEKADEDGKVLPESESEREETKQDKLTEAETIEKKKREKAQQTAAAGGAGTAGTAEAAESQGHISASQGSVLNYGASLRALISSNTPRNIRKTSVRLSFSIAPSGAVTAVGVSKPSSNPEVDKRMVELVRTLSSRFPPPPPGARADQLAFNIEIIFR